MTPFEQLINSLEKVQKRGKNYMACCPAHDDKSPSLAVAELDDGRVLIKCFAGCDPQAIVSAVGLTLSDLFPNKGVGQQYRDFRSLETHRAPKPNDKIEHEKTILQIAKADRANGKRLSTLDLQRERLAFMRVKKHAEDHR
jgi:hypothetical protein